MSLWIFPFGQDDCGVVVSRDSGSVAGMTTIYGFVLTAFSSGAHLGLDFIKPFINPVGLN